MINYYMSRQFENDTNAKIQKFIEEKKNESFSKMDVFVDELKKQKSVSFEDFFFAFTFFRKNSLYKEMNDIYREFKNIFKEEKLIKHIALLNDAKFANDKNDLYDLISKAKTILDSDDEYKNHIGFLHHYAELCATYFEYNLDERDNIILKDAYKCAQHVIQIEAYYKFFLTKGRLETLLGFYDDAKDSIGNAISKIPLDENHAAFVATYEIYLNKISLVKAYDVTIKKTNETSKDLQNQKLDNIKVIGMFSSIIVFLLGGIEAFQTISDYKTIARVMTMYCGMAIIMIGLVYIFFKLLSKDNSKKYASYILSALCIILGIALIITMWLIQ